MPHAQRTEPATITGQFLQRIRRYRPEDLGRTRRLLRQYGTDLPILDALSFEVFGKPLHQLLSEPQSRCGLDWRLSSAAASAATTTARLNGWQR